MVSWHLLSRWKLLIHVVSMIFRYGITHATVLVIVSKRASVCGDGKDCTSLWFRCSYVVLPSVTSSAPCRRALKVGMETVLSGIDFFASSTRNFDHFGPHEEVECVQTPRVGVRMRRCRQILRFRLP